MSVQLASETITPPPSALDNLASRNRRFFPKGTTLFCCGDRCRALYKVFDGIVELHLPRQDGEMVLAHLVGPGQWLGEGALLLDRGHAVSAHVRADASIGMIDPADFCKEATLRPELWRELGAIAALNQRAAAQSYLDAGIGSPEVRLASVLLRLLRSVGVRGRHRLASIVPVSQTELGQLSSLSRNSVSRILVQLERDGLVMLRYRAIEVLEIGALAALAGSAGHEEI